VRYFEGEGIEVGSRAMARKGKLYREIDPRGVPAYYPAIASHNLDIPPATLKSWFIGRHYKTQRGEGRFRPLITPASQKPLLLSFTNLVEAHVLSIIRFVRRVPMDRIRVALDWLEATYGEQPLANHGFLTSRRDLFVEMMDDTINASMRGQRIFREHVPFFLQRIERDEEGLAKRFFPILRRYIDEGFENAPAVVVIDPLVCFGRPTIAGSGIPVDVLAERVRASETPQAVADDVGLNLRQVTEAVRWESREKEEEAA
jgi:uncharacterized protein (DUF433 family)